ncbi:uncharacterized protein LTR77_004545 [Saxophila tyrrhenica]|uniref:Prion-inhibition and propagation HeLo domain-containing protein n=1 Tax=Saxophila tyrrhenica TaxID=1690608 RepID=A0AAV9PD41_9PEZI|nr:hypothetical protein LTR77_004545 [Saxophila tyrrhenica]
MPTSTAKPSNDQLERVTSSEHEAILTSVISLTSVFSACVEAFNLIHPSYKWEKGERLLLCRLGLQQARLLIWGDVVGISSPPATVTDRAVPKHPSPAYPDLKEPTFFGVRDARLEDAEVRTQVEAALSDIVDRSSHTSREEAMAKYGLKPPKKFLPDYEPALDLNRLEGFREKWELLREVAESYAQLETRRNASITRTSWAIADLAKFDGFIKLTQAKIDELIQLMDVKEQVDRGMRMDIKALGWHLSADKSRVAQDTSKLRLITEICQEEYPEYLDATKAALDNIDRERRESAPTYNPYTSAPASAPVASQAPRRGSTPAVKTAQTNGTTNGASPKPKQGGLFGSFFKFGRSKSSLNAGRSQSVSAASSTPQEDPGPPRALSDAGPARPGDEEADPNTLERARSKSVGAMPADFTMPQDEVAPQAQADSPMEETKTVRSKSVGEILDIRPDDAEEEEARGKLERLDTGGTDRTMEDDVKAGNDLKSAVSRHDMFHGLGRQGTKVQW